MSGGLITTRAASESNLGEEVAVQLLARVASAGRGRRRAGRAGADSGPAEAVVPRSSAALLGLAAYAEPRSRRSASAATPPRPQRRRPRHRTLEAAHGRRSAGVEVGYALVSLVDEKQGGTLLNRGARHPPADRHRDRHRRAAGARRRQPAAAAARVRDSRQGRRGRARRAVSPIVSWPSTRRRRHAARGLQTREPAFGLPATWIMPEQREQATDRRASPSSIRRRRCRRTCRRRSARSCRICSAGSRRRNWSTASRRRSPKLVEELVPKLASVGDIQRVLRQLLRERVSVRDLTTILEAIADAWPSRRIPTR